ncbi:MAG: exosome complex RNA-binding protein Csl4 [Desulfurococcales archaeon]|nr:exosome complex RNA-binding protein Csl4 [Desulfurococcales archaeon]
MQRIDELRNKDVLPGDELCVIEEFLPGYGTFEKEGVVRAAWAGKVQVDMVARTVSVLPIKGVPRLPERNSVIYGVVAVVKDEFAIIKILKDLRGVEYPSGFTGLLHISQASDRHVKDLYEVIRVGDIVKGKVLSDHPPYNLTLREPRLGVVLAFCGECGAILKKTGPDTVKCPKCGRIEKRKLSVDYGKVKGITT